LRVVATGEDLIERCADESVVETTARLYYLQNLVQVERRVFILETAIALLAMVTLTTEEKTTYVIYKRSVVAT
jgi:hypothetical protein